MNKLSVLIAGLAICISAGAQQKTIQVSDIVSGTFSAQGIGAITPMADGEHYLQQSGRLILKYSFKTGAVTDTILNLDAVKGEQVGEFNSFLLAPGEETLLLETPGEKIFRRSFTSNYYIYTIRNNRLDALSKKGPQQVPSYSPDGHNIAFVRENNIFLVKLMFGNAEVQVTKDGTKDRVRNGIPDWAYEEEFSFTRAYEFSADSRIIAWIRFDEQNVESYSMPFFSTGTDSGVNRQELLTYRPQQYPTAGAVISKTSVHTFDIKSSVIRDIELKTDSNTYIPRIQFAPNESNSLFIYTLNRNQNKLEIYSANPLSTVSTLVLRQEDKCYIDCPTYMDTQIFGDCFIMQSEQDGWNHLYKYGLNGKLIKQLTKGEWEVTAFHGYDSKTGTAYYESNESGMYDNAVWKVSSKGQRTILTPSKGTSHATFSAQFKYFYNVWSDMDTPNQITLLGGNGKLIRTIESGKQLAATAAGYGIQKKELFSFKTVDGTTLYGWMIRPAGASASKPCPLIMYQYSGPGSCEMLNEWGAGFYPGGSFETLLTQHGYAVAVVDPRGTGRRGAAFKKQTYGKIGIMEADDQVAAAKYLGSLDFIDSSRMAIWGWSYGGYMTLMSMAQGSDVFKCGVAVAPVTDWRYYDAPYTERFMKQPKENAWGYDESSVLTRIDKLTGRLLLVHGLDDDNVFFSNSSALIDALVNNGVDFDLMVYTGKEHSITGGVYRTHLFTKIVKFFNDNL